MSIQYCAKVVIFLRKRRGKEAAVGNRAASRSPLVMSKRQFTGRVFIYSLGALNFPQRVVIVMAAKAIKIGISGRRYRAQQSAPDSPIVRTKYAAIPAMQKIVQRELGLLIQEPIIPISPPQITII